MHTTEFVRFGLSQLAQEDSRYTSMVLPTGETLHSDDAVNVDCEQLTLTSRFQMPRFDLVTAAGDGITMINIGVGPSNAKTITDRKSTRLNSSHVAISYAVFCLKKKN